ncbi:MAG: hypothetical protein ACXAEU_25770 [Candidatus Hodarchaeales archaeon]|jgi:hypothetical protein
MTEYYDFAERLLKDKYGSGNTAEETREVTRERIDRITLSQTTRADDTLLEKILLYIQNIDIRLKRLEELFVFDEATEIEGLPSRAEIKSNIISLLESTERSLYMYEIADSLNLELQVVAEIIEGLKEEGLIE